MPKKKDIPMMLLLAFPATALFSVFLIYPISQAFYMSFFEWPGIAQVPMTFVGWDNFQRIFASARFWTSVRNVMWFLVGSYFVLMPLAFTLALIITSKLKMRRFFKTAYFIPVVIPMAAIGLIWQFILSPNGGLVNTFLAALSLPEPLPNWLGDPRIAIYTVVLINTWVWAGFNMLIFAAGITAIPEELYESASIEGANKRQQLFNITIPLCKESFKIFAIMAAAYNMRAFDIVFVLTRGGPANSTEVPATLLYNEAFTYTNFGVGSAIGVFIFIVGFLLSFIAKSFFDIGLAREGR